MTLKAFMSWSWPGNVRELRNIIESAFNFEINDKITLGSVSGILEEVNKSAVKSVDDDQSEEMALLPQRNWDLEECTSIEHIREMLKTGSVKIEELLADYERKIIQEALRQNRKLKTASEKLGISPQKLNYRLHKVDLKDCL